MNSLFIDLDALDDNSSRFFLVLLLDDEDVELYESLLSHDEVDVVELIEEFFNLKVPIDVVNLIAIGLRTNNLIIKQGLN